VDESFDEPVELDGSDSTRIRRGEAGQRAVPVLIALVL
jgi:hypothetical protein